MGGKNSFVGLDSQLFRPHCRSKLMDNTNILKKSWASEAKMVCVISLFLYGSTKGQLVLHHR